MSLKETTPSQTGLKKLPKSVRNTMGYMKSGGVSTKKKTAKKKKKETIVGIIGDTHLPYELDGYMDWCKSVFDTEGVNKVIHIGDLFDNHALSFHDSEPALKGARGEYLVRDMLREHTGHKFERVPASGALEYLKGDLYDFRSR